MLKWLETILFRPSVHFWSFLENGTSNGTECCVHLNSASVYSSCNTIYCKMPYNKISIVIDLFNLFGIQKIFKKTFEKTRPLSAVFLTGYISAPIWITIMS